MLRDYLIPALKTAFPAAPFEYSGQGNLVASLPIPNRIGDLKLCDDGDEITVFLGDVTHCHFSQDYLGDGKYSSEPEVCDAVIQYLTDLFSERVFFYHARDRRRDGSGPVPPPDELEEIKKDCRCFVWSRALN
jgi:hypothetical protein